MTPDDLARMFAPNSGLMDSFFRDNLQGKVDTTRANWRFTPGVDGKTRPAAKASCVRSSRRSASATPSSPTAPRRPRTA
ncbi:hypothetical protein M8494_06260 [Serratia ureilytica]